MKKRLWIGCAVVFALLVAGALLLRFVPFGAPAGNAFTMNTESGIVTAAEKLALKADIDSRMAGQVSVNEGVRLTAVEQLLLEYGCTGNQFLLTDLMEEGIYLLEQPGRHSVNTENAARNGVNVTILSPAVFYDGYTQEWIVLCGGWWNSDLWESRFAGDLGGRNGFGVTYSDITGEYTSHVASAAAVLWPGESSEVHYSYTTARSSGDGRSSIDFELQDYITITGLYDRHYIGEQWAGFVRYAPGFETYEAAMTAYYTCD